MDRLLEGRVFIVTGSTQGLGQAISEHLAERGAAGLTICGRQKQAGQAVADRLNNVGARCVFVPADLTREEDCLQVAAACVDEFGRLDGLVNAAGATSRGTLEETTTELWDRLFSLNTRAPFILIRETVKWMKAARASGSIVNIISDQYHGGFPFLSAYAASKGALATLTKNTANALRRDRIRVNGICLGWMVTPNEDKAQQSMGKGENWLAEAEARQPFGRILRPRDVAFLAAYLLSDQSRMMTGSLIDFNQQVIGGMDED